MEADFWLERWQQGQIGFHQPDFHPALGRYWPSMPLDRPARVFVPLCGRSLDLVWFARRGFSVLGIELSPIAVAGFFGHESLNPATRAEGSLVRYSSGPYEILQGDFFDLSPDIVGLVDGWYDRAALVALPPDMRRRYAQHLAGLLPGGATGLLIAHEYPQEAMPGPPFSVPLDEVRELFDRDFQVELLEQRDIIAEAERFRERGLDRFHEMVFRLARR